MTTSDISHGEKRLIRREWINTCLQTNHEYDMKPPVQMMTGFVRQQERAVYGNQMKAYTAEWWESEDRDAGVK